MLTEEKRRGRAERKRDRRNAAESRGPEVALSQEPRREKVVCGTDKRERKRKKENEDTSSTPILLITCIHANAPTKGSKNKTVKIMNPKTIIS